MLVYGKRINLNFWLLPCFPVVKITYISFESPYSNSASHVSTGIVPATNRKQLLMISGRVRLPSLPPSKETVCLITTRIDRVNATRTNRFTDLMPPPVGPPSECDFMQVSLHP